MIENLNYNVFILQIQTVGFRGRYLGRSKHTHTYKQDYKSSKPLEEKKKKTAYFLDKKRPALIRSAQFIYDFLK